MSGTAGSAAARAGGIGGSEGSDGDGGDAGVSDFQVKPPGDYHENTLVEAAQDLMIKDEGRVVKKGRRGRILAVTDEDIDKGRVRVIFDYREDCQHIPITVLPEMIRECKAIVQANRHLPLPHQEQVDTLYNSTKIQGTIAFLISANFLSNCVEKQVDPDATKYHDVFRSLEIFFNIAFAIELFVHLYAEWFSHFWKSAWNIFDVVVVSIGIINMLELDNLPEELNLLRLMRAFRVFRLFKRVRSLRKITTSIVHAVPGIRNAFIILTIVMCIFSLLAVELFINVGTDCLDLAPVYESAREYCIGGEYFGTFTRSFYTFFQVLTGESWSEAVSRPVLWYYHDSLIKSFGSAMFFVVFFLITNMVLINVVVGILLDKMNSGHFNNADEALSDSDLQAQAPLTEEELTAYSRIDEVRGSLEKITSHQKGMQLEFDRTREDMASMKELIATLVKALEHRSDLRTRFPENKIASI